MSEFEFRKAGATDIEMLIDFRMRFADELSGKQEPEIEDKIVLGLRAYFTAELNKSYYSWYAVADGNVVSIAGICIRNQPPNFRNHSGIWGYIVGVYTIPGFRGRGLSAGVMDKLIDTAKEKNVGALELHATPEGEKVYLKKGFVLHDEPTYRLKIG